MVQKCVSKSTENCDADYSEKLDTRLKTLLNREDIQIQCFGPCTKHPCLNNGICMQNVKEYTCQCPLGFGGKNCETETCLPDKARARIMEYAEQFWDLTALGKDILSIACLDINEVVSKVEEYTDSCPLHKQLTYKFMLAKFHNIKENCDNYDKSIYVFPDCTEKNIKLGLTKCLDSSRYTTDLCSVWNNQTTRHIQSCMTDAGGCIWLRGILGYILDFVCPVQMCSISAATKCVTDLKYELGFKDRIPQTCDASKSCSGRGSGEDSKSHEGSKSKSHASKSKSHASKGKSHASKSQSHASHTKSHASGSAEHSMGSHMMSIPWPSSQSFEKMDSEERGEHTAFCLKAQAVITCVHSSTVQCSSLWAESFNKTLTMAIEKTSVDEKCDDPCQLEPCQNLGTCEREGMFGYSCTCMAGFTGKHCDIEPECDLLKAATCMVAAKARLGERLLPDWKNFTCRASDSDVSFLSLSATIECLAQNVLPCKGFSSEIFRVMYIYMRFLQLECEGTPPPSSQCMVEGAAGCSDLLLSEIWQQAASPSPNISHICWNLRLSTQCYFNLSLNCGGDTSLAVSISKAINVTISNICPVPKCDIAVATKCIYDLDWKIKNPECPDDDDSESDECKSDKDSDSSSKSKESKSSSKKSKKSSKKSKKGSKSKSKSKSGSSKKSKKSSNEKSKCKSKSSKSSKEKSSKSSKEKSSKSSKEKSSKSSKGKSSKSSKAKSQNSGRHKSHKEHDSGSCEEDICLVMDATMECVMESTVDCPHGIVKAINQSLHNVLLQLGDECEAPCGKEPCHNGATCEEVGEYEYKCICPPGYMGENCDRVIGCDLVEITKCLISVEAVLIHYIDWCDWEKEICGTIDIKINCMRNLTWHCSEEVKDSIANIMNILVKIEKECKEDKNTKNTTHPDDFLETVCYKCRNEDSNDACNDASRPEKCELDEVCQTIFDHPNKNKQYTKGCKNKDACANQEGANLGGKSGYCCDGYLCNQDPENDPDGTSVAIPDKKFCIDEPITCDKSLVKDCVATFSHQLFLELKRDNPNFGKICVSWEATLQCVFMKSITCSGPFRVQLNRTLEFFHAFVGEKCYKPRCFEKVATECVRGIDEVITEYTTAVANYHKLGRVCRIVKEKIECIRENIIECSGPIKIKIEKALNATLIIIDGRCDDPCLSDPCLHGGKCVKIDVNNFQCECLPGWTGDFCDIDLKCDLKRVRGCLAEAREFLIKRIMDPCGWHDSVCGEIAGTIECLQSNVIACNNQTIVNIEQVIQMILKLSEKCPADDDNGLMCYQCNKKYSNDRCNDGSYEICKPNEVCQTVVHGTRYTKGCKNVVACLAQERSAGTKTGYCCNENLCNADCENESCSLARSPPGGGDDEECVEELPTCEVESIRNCVTYFYSEVFFELEKDSPNFGKICKTWDATLSCTITKSIKCSGPLQVSLNHSLSIFEQNTGQKCSGKLCFVDAAQQCIRVVNEYVTPLYIQPQGLIIAGSHLPDFCGSVKEMLTCVRDSIVECSNGDRIIVETVLNKTLVMIGDKCDDPCINDPCKNGGTCEATGKGNWKCTCPMGWTGRSCETENVCDIETARKCLLEIKGYIVKKITDPCDWEKEVCGEITASIECVQSSIISCSDEVVARIDLILKVAIKISKECEGGDQTCYDCTNAKTNDECNNLVKECDDPKFVCQTIVHEQQNQGTLYKKSCKNEVACRNQRGPWNGAKKTGYCCRGSLCNDNENTWDNLDQTAVSTNTTAVQPPECGPDPTTCSIEKVAECIKTFTAELILEWSRDNPNFGKICMSWRKTRECTFSMSLECSGEFQLYLNRTFGLLWDISSNWCSQPICWQTTATTCIHSLELQYTAIMSSSNIKSDDLRKFCGYVKETHSCVTDNSIECSGLIQVNMTERLNVTIEKTTTMCPDPCLINPCLNLGTCHPAELSNNYKCACAAGWAGTRCQKVDIMYKWGLAAGDKVLHKPVNEHDVYISKKIRLDQGLRMHGHRYTHMHISERGYISFRYRYKAYIFYKFPEVNSGKALIAALLAKQDLACGGSIYYHIYESTSTDAAEQAILTLATKHVREYGTNMTDFKAELAITVTWNNTEPYRCELFETLYPDTNKGNTYQVVLVSDGMRTVALLNYGDVNLQHQSPNAYMGYVFKRKDYIYYASGTAAMRNFHQIKGSMTGIEGRHFLQLYTAADLEPAVQTPEEKCNAWAHSTVDIHIPAYKDMYMPCPCSSYHAALDTRYIPASYDFIRQCYWTQASKTSADGLRFRQMCCYSLSNNALLDYAPLAGYVFVESGLTVSDHDAYNWCCVQSHTYSYLFFSLRANNYKCPMYNPPTQALLWGDPHIITLDGKSYTFNGIGEYTMIEVTEGSKFDLQCRTTQSEDRNNNPVKASAFSAFAAKDQNTATVQVQLSADKKGLELVIGGQQQSEFMSSSAINRQSISNIDISKNGTANVTIAFPSQWVLTVSAANKMLSIMIAVPSNAKQSTRGLLGVYNDNPDDDFTAPDASVLPADSSLETIHYKFGEKWRVSDENSLFYYPPGTSLKDYHNKDFLPAFYAKCRTSQLEDEANQMCETSATCKYDYCMTEDREIALNTKRWSDLYDTNKEKLQNTAPTLSGPKEQPLQATVDQDVVFVLQATDDDKDDITIEMVGDIAKEAFLDPKTGKFKWTPTHLEPLELAFVAKDSRGAASAIYKVRVILCSKCSGHGVCDFDSSETSTYQLAECICDPGWTGSSCDVDIPGCVDNPCEPIGSVCVDLTPQEQLQSGLPYKCADCRDGYDLSGGECIDIDECLAKPDKCPQNCLNTEGSFVCTCWDGYRKHGEPCIDIDECEERTHNCEQLCVNTNGSFSCNCYTGYTLDRTSNTCQQDAACTKQCAYGCSKDPDTGVESCICRSGYNVQKDGSCVNVDECKEPALNKCDKDYGHCVDVDGSYNCSCVAGYTVSSSDLRTCQPCNASHWGVNCANECNCGVNVKKCTATAGCSVCHNGWKGALCEEDIDECDSGVYTCPPDSYCKNTPGSYTCRCNAGFTLTTDDKCEVVHTGTTEPRPSTEKAQVAMVIVLDILWDKRLLNMDTLQAQNQITEFKRVFELVYHGTGVPGFKSVSIHRFFESSLGVDHVVLFDHDLSVEEQTQIAMAMVSAIEARGGGIVVNSYFRNLRRTPAMIINGKEVPITDACFLYNELKVCENDGECFVNATSPQCSCADGFKGRLCEDREYEGALPKDTLRTLIIAFSVLGALLLIGLAIFIVLMCRERCVRRDNQGMYQRNMLDGSESSVKDEEMEKNTYGQTPRYHSHWWGPLGGDKASRHPATPHDPSAAPQGAQNYKYVSRVYHQDTSKPNEQLDGHTTWKTNIQQ